MTSPRANRATDQAVDFDELLDDPGVAAAAEDAEVRYQLLDALVGTRKSSGLTQKQVARSMETTQSAVSEFENGQTDPHLSTVQRYARAVGVRIAVHIEGSATPKRGEVPLEVGRVSVNRAPSESLETGYFATYARCATVGRRSSYAKAA